MTESADGAQASNERPPAASDGRGAAELRRVMAATDFQLPSRAAVTWAVRHFVGDGQLVMVHVASNESQRKGAEATLDARVAELPLRHVRGVVRVGEPADEIVRAAKDYDADLIVLGEHTDRSELGQLRGRTGASVARRATVPVLIARNVDAGAPRSVLVALHESPSLPVLVEWVTRIATRFSASVTAIHVVSPSVSVPLTTSSLGVSPERRLDQLTRESGRWLDDATASLRGTVAGLTTRVVFGDPASEILAAADSGADLVVVGRGGVGRFLGRLLGGTTNRVLRSGHAALLIVPVPAARR